MATAGTGARANLLLTRAPRLRTVRSGGGQVIPPDPSQSGALISGGPDELPSVDGIPCTPQQLGACIGLAESAR